ncbi:hypothetical protein [Clostridium intestinale]|uniref:Uncharacterized protein n=1 Tax=Clostridium intestinale URNW TaxID=1294142 RepID=U2N9W2_9CLOT|nr:hypothetical protein [Clostridium intestinale]ERK32307.1 hypothetical protein CINTURNW_0288 [Clostridium intestinale URNW]
MGKLNNKNGVSQGEEEYEKFGVWGEVNGGHTIRELDIADLVEEKLKNNPIKNVTLETKKEKKVTIEREYNHSDTKYKKNFYLGFPIISMLNDLKVKHPNVNVRISKIVESAIKHYYKYIMEEGGSQEE